MLVLTRKEGESIIIMDDITITLLSIDNHRAKFGIEAPSNITVHRKEIYERIKAETNGYFKK